MKLDEVRKGPIRETLDSRQDLSWAQEDDETFISYFVIEDRSYEIIARVEEAEGFKIVRVDFRAGESVAATDLHKDQFKALGIVKNGIVEKFSSCDGFYFVAKKNADPDHFQSRKKLYGRMKAWMAAEHDLHQRSEERADEVIYYLGKTADVMRVMTGEDLGR